jgi:hypothetical protein
MLRICREVRIFPLLDLNAGESAVLPGITGALRQGPRPLGGAGGVRVSANGNRMLRIVKGNGTSTR